MSNNLLIYPIIVTECHDEAGHYYGAISPNIPGMVTDGQTLQELVIHAEDAIATMISGTKYPEVQDLKEWTLGPNDFVVYVTVNMLKWEAQHEKTVRRNITLPEGLNNWAKDNKINVSKVTTEALRSMKNTN